MTSLVRYRRNRKSRILTLGYGLFDRSRRNKPSPLTKDLTKTVSDKTSLKN